MTETLPDAVSPRQPDRDTQKSERVAIVVLGMHRSGTSTLSGILAQMGCDAPAQLMPPDDHNVKGFFESQPISALNNDILNSAGTRWSDWAPISDSWYDSPKKSDFLAQARNLLIAEFGRSPLIVLKDPRMCRLVPFWAEALELEGFQPRIAHIHRNPQDVAQSLLTRNGFDLEFSRLLWLRYVLDAEYQTRGMARSFHSYDRLLQDWSGQVERIQTTLEIGLPRGPTQAARDIEAFLDPSMRHFNQDPAQTLRDPNVPDWCGDCLEILERWAETGETSGDRTVLDHIAADFDRITPIFSDLVRDAFDRRRLGDTLKKKLTETEAEQAALAAQTVRLESELAAAQRAVEEQKSLTHEATSEIARLGAALAQTKAEREQMAVALAEQERALQSLQAEFEPVHRKLRQRGTLLIEAEEKQRQSDRELAALACLQVEMQDAINTALGEARDAKKQVNQTRMNALNDLVREQMRHLDLAARYSGTRAHQLRRDMRLLAGSDLFDAEYYLTTNPDVRDAELDPARHFLLSGCGEGRNPSAQFDTVAYYRHNPDVLLMRSNALLHYIRHGHAERRRFHEDEGESWSRPDPA